ncbi:hypothetical protein ACQKWADRAFT_326071 [Trichoderma austrokoningii]
MSIFEKKYSISFAFLGGWAVYLREEADYLKKGKRCLQDVDLTVDSSVEDLKQALVQEVRICIPKRHEETSIRVLVWTGGGWDAKFPGTSVLPISINIIIKGHMGTPSKLPKGTELLQLSRAAKQLLQPPRAAKEDAKSIESVPVIDIYYQFATTLRRHYDKGFTRNSDEFYDLQFLVTEYGHQIYKWSGSLNSKHKQVFYEHFAAENEKISMENVKGMRLLLGISEDSIASQR